jgi:hypothetical protein
VRSPVEHVALFNEWADQAEDLSRAAYNRWQKAYAAEAASAGLPLPLSSSQLLRTFPGVTFEELVELRAAGADLTEAVRERVEQKLAERPNPLGFVSVAEAAGLLGWSETSVRSAANEQRAGFPVVVAFLSGARVFLAEDVRAFIAEGRAPQRQVGERQDRFLDRDALAEALGMASSTLYAAVLRKRSTVPPPDGYVGRSDYWLPATVEAFKSSR